MLRIPVQALAFIALYGNLSWAAEPMPSSNKPIILFALADDQSWLDVSAMGSAIAKTPAFDRVAKEGVLMTHAFATCPSCPLA
ncbi:MAG: N-sulfoglucosamine sulfohydrolase [Verrucomicrobiales bacterium]|jgi:N-sulfoglucosamine sulfohydrolase